MCDSDGDTIIYDYKTEKEGDVPFFEDVKELKRGRPVILRAKRDKSN